jgi:thymidylate synthase
MSFACAFDQGYDQLEALVAGIRKDPFSRRHLMTTFNPAVVDKCVLAPCHGIAIQFYVEEVSWYSAPGDTVFDLSCHVYCRSSDSFLGLPFNIASYAVLTALIAKKCGFGNTSFRPKELIVSTGDTHIYSNHVTQAWTQVGRSIFPSPLLFVSDAVASKDWSEITIDDFDVAGYLCHPAIKAEMAI